MDGNDVLRAGLYGSWILVCVICVASFCLCLFWAVKGNHPLMLSLNTPLKLNWKQKALLIGAALLLLVAMYQGGKAFFAWIPASWGTIDEDGDFKTYQEGIGGTIGAICGLFLVAYLNDCLARALAIKVAVSEIKWLERIYEGIIRFETEIDAGGGQRVMGRPREDATARR